MSVDNLSAVLHAKGDLRMEQREVPTAGRGKLLIRIHTVGICGSDVHFLKNGLIGPFVVRAPMVLGHESSGTVEALGEGVEGFAVGDRVAMEPGIPCRTCTLCKTGVYNLCHKATFFATPPDHGTLTRFITHDADFCFKLPDHVSYEEGALLEPLSVAVHTCRRAAVTVGQRVLVCGAGPIGSLCMMVARSHGVSAVVITDIDDGRLALAKELGAEHTINVRGLSVEQIREKVHAALGRAPDVTMECTGVTSSIETAIMSTRSGGVIMQVGMSAPRVELPLIEAAAREVDIRGAFRYANCYPTALEMVASKRIDLSKLTRTHYKLEDTLEAFQHSMKGEVLKVFIKCDETR